MQVPTDALVNIAKHAIAAIMKDIETEIETAPEASINIVVYTVCAALADAAYQPLFRLAPDVRGRLEQAREALGRRIHEELMEIVNREVV